MFKKKTTKKMYFKDYSDWIAHGPRNTQAKCRNCKVNFELENMGRGSLTSHGKGKSHEFKVKEAKKTVDFLKPSRKRSSSNLFPDVSLKGLDNFYVQPTALATFEKGDKLCAEIRWALKHVLSGYRYNSFQDTVSIFKSMFPDSEVAEKMELDPIN